MKNKKGLEVYLPFLAILSIIVFTWTAYTISSVSHEDSIFKAGETSKYLIQIYDEAEKALFYIKESTRLASDDAFKTICDNAGYKDGECKKETLFNGRTYVDWNSCSKLDPETNYFEQFKFTLKSYFQNYKSFYPESKDGFTDSYSQLINNLEINFIEGDTIYFKELTYHIETQRNTTYNVKPISKIITPDFIEFNKIYNSFSSCTDLPSCAIKLPDYKISSQGSKIYLSSENKDCQIQITVDKSKPLQGRVSAFT
ncbi:hypothetical protein J4459_04055 [Candidatus Woesearchaeota archaeon]|nr:hypothetical protein [Candidatus Woesearchaeota archaeon]